MANLFVTAESDRLDPISCDAFNALVEKWGVDPTLLDELVRLNLFAEPNLGSKLYIISGHRTVDEQNELLRQGKTVVPGGQSQHNNFPSTAIDIGTDFSFSRQEWITLDAVARCRGVASGVHWTPSDPNHFFLQNA